MGESGAGRGGRRALVLLSGGLDSMLAAELLRRCGVEVVGIAFTSPFFGSAKAEKAAAYLGLPLVVRDITGPHLEVVKAPRFGYGRNLNPCIDCHALMVAQALAMLRELEAHFIATGEVLGERPKSQNRRALDLVASASGAGELLLRPLSARLLPETLPEREGWVRREEMLDISGRSRRRQMELAEAWGIREYETPAGGCLLTDPGFSSRLRELLGRVPECDRRDVELIKLGRQVWRGKTLLVLGRRHEENLLLQETALPSDVLCRERDRPGPTALLRTFPRGASPSPGDLAEAARLLGIYGKGKTPLEVADIVVYDGGELPGDDGGGQAAGGA
ncbi:MAG: tRNA 4-thiouridine(8) synthase ThiI [Actinobacteria bacterium]|nr:tRNA 4-thiouridine(8) synthase ThiI [Actinomycetota bacterium]